MKPEIHMLYQELSPRRAKPVTGLCPEVSPHKFLRHIRILLNRVVGVFEAHLGAGGRGCLFTTCLQSKARYQAPKDLEALLESSTPLVLLYKVP